MHVSTGPVGTTSPLLPPLPPHPGGLPGGSISSGGRSCLNVGAGLLSCAGRRRPWVSQGKRPLLFLEANSHSLEPLEVVYISNFFSLMKNKSGQSPALVESPGPPPKETRSQAQSPLRSEF